MLFVLLRYLSNPATSSIVDARRLLQGGRLDMFLGGAAAAWISVEVALARAREIAKGNSRRQGGLIAGHCEITLHMLSSTTCCVCLERVGWSIEFVQVCCVSAFCLQYFFGPL
jgi:hypothetical protein